MPVGLRVLGIVFLEMGGVGGQGRRCIATRRCWYLAQLGPVLALLFRAVNCALEQGVNQQGSDLDRLRLGGLEV
jgi:hypothetical protein